MQIFNAPVLLQKNSGQLYYVYLNEEGQLFYCSTEGDGKWSDATLYLSNIQGFAASITESDRIYLITADSSGNLSSRQLPPEDKGGEIFYTDEEKSLSHFSLLSYGEVLHLVYLALDYQQKRWWLLYQRLENDRWQEPQVVDFGNGAGVNYAVPALDPGGRLHLVYRVLEAAKYRLYYRSFQVNDFSWSTPVILSRPGTDNHFPLLLIDHNFNCHVCWASFDGNKYCICYRRRLRGGWPTGGWQKAVALSSPAESIFPPTFFQSGGKLAVIWREGEKLYRRLSPDNGESWAVNPGIADGNKYVLLRWASNKGEEGEGKKMHRWIYGIGNPPVNLLNVFEDFDEGAEGDVKDDKNPEPQFQDLKKYSENLVRRAGAFSRAKLELERALEGKNQELALLSHQYQKQYHTLQNQLAAKDKELQELEEKFKQALNELQEKILKDRREAELKIQKVRKEAQQLREALHKKENELREVKSALQKNEAKAAQVLAQNAELEKRIGELEKEVDKYQNNIWANLAKKFRLIS